MLIILWATTTILPLTSFAVNFSSSIRYGKLQLLPSLTHNANLQLEENKFYSDLWFEGAFSISEHLFYTGSVQVTNQPNQLINTKYSRPDYPLSTGRVQRSAIHYKSDRIAATLGREDMLRDGMKPTIFDYPLTADGFSWEMQLNGYRFKHVFQVLPGEQSSGQVFRRSVSYHHLSKRFGNLEFGLGEYFILTGEHIPFDLKRLNPFLPFIINSHDSEADLYSGYAGDSDNSLIKLFIQGKSPRSEIFMKLYIDEFQIDAVDREANNDALLLSLLVHNQLSLFGLEHLVNWGFSLSNPNFGQHPGPFTTTTIGLYPMFEYSPGMKNLIFFDSSSRWSDHLSIQFSGHHTNWVNISELSPADMNQRAKLGALETFSDSRISYGLMYEPKQFPMKLGIKGWSGSDSGLMVEAQLFSRVISSP